MLKKAVCCIASLLFAAGAQAQPYLFNRAPLEEVSYAELPLGAIRPEGWLKEQLNKADALPGPSTSSAAASVTTTPHINKEEMAPEVVMIVDRASEFKEVVKPYQFTSLAMVSALPEDKQELLIQKIVGESVPYGVAMLLHLGYDTHLKSVYGYNKTQIAKHLASCLNSNERTIRGNISVIKNDSSTESTTTYTAAIHRDAVKAYYKSLTESD